MPTATKPVERARRRRARPTRPTAPSGAPRGRSCAATSRRPVKERAAPSASGPGLPAAPAAARASRGRRPRRLRRGRARRRPTSYALDAGAAAITTPRASRPPRRGPSSQLATSSTASSNASPTRQARRSTARGAPTRARRSGSAPSLGDGRRRRPGEVRAECAHGVEQLGGAMPLGRDRLDDRRAPLVSRPVPRSSIWSRSRRVSAHAGAVGLVDDEHVGHLEEPCLVGLHRVAPPRFVDDDGRVGGRRRSPPPSGPRRRSRRARGGSPPPRARAARRAPPARARRGGPAWPSSG